MPNPDRNDSLTGPGMSSLSPNNISNIVSKTMCILLRQMFQNIGSLL